MIVTLTNSAFTLLAKTQKEADALFELREFLSYNDPDYWYGKYLKATTEDNEAKMDWNDPDAVKAFSYEAEQWPYYQNYLCKLHYEMTGEGSPDYNYVTGEPFNRKTETHDFQVYLFEYPSRVQDGLITPPIPSGFLKDTLVFLQDELGETFDYELVDQRINLVTPHITKEPVYKLPNGVELWDNQKRVIDKIRTTLTDTESGGHMFHNTSLSLATNFGKSFVSLGLLQQFPGCATASFYNSKNLAFKAVLEAIEAGLDVGIVMADKAGLRKYLKARGCAYKYKDGFAQYTVIMCQTLKSRLTKGKITREDLKFFKIGVFDEADKLVTPTGLFCFSHFSLGLYLAMSGTLFDDFAGARRFAVYALGGSQRYEVEHHELVKTGQSIDIEYVLIPNDFSREALTSMTGAALKVKQSTGEMSTSLKKSYIYRRDLRIRRLIWAMKLHPDSQILIYAGQVHIEDMEYLRDKLLEAGFDVRLTWGDDPDRDKNFLDFYSARYQVCISNHIIGVGVNLPEIEIVFYWSASGSKSDFKQGPVGRLSRTPKLKKFTSGKIYDFEDNDARGTYWLNSCLRKMYARESKLKITRLDEADLPQLKVNKWKPE